MNLILNVLAALRDILPGLDLKSSAWVVFRRGGCGNSAEDKSCRENNLSLDQHNRFSLLFIMPARADLEIGGWPAGAAKLPFRKLNSILCALRGSVGASADSG
jgi:hypothetical protein